MPSQALPVVLILAGNDPSGGAGLAADTAAVLSLGGHPAPVVTAVTVQDTRRVQRFEPVPPTLIVEQARAVLEDMPVAAIKLGMLGSAAVAEAVHGVLLDYPGLPVILDPVLHAGGGGALSDLAMLDALRDLLLPQTTLLTPNLPEALALAPDADGCDAAGAALRELGAQYVLVTGGHADGETVVNRLYSPHGGCDPVSWPRLPGEFHGSGCTLAAAAATLIAQGEMPAAAARDAQRYTWHALQVAHRPGRGQSVPDRLFWARDPGRDA
ncbi:bifunctional hydroxymethylpyrimidine kinase/phosphomethylpyrimidine kinase [Acidihalobacter ferrooxydans]|uniref:hydroxymethylpyrimidine kinase n=1 Tax=Acidihalobacter ferrooxydans TaxID=1765967 RepID=A0A1P8UEF4_9GAMM|nr:hydroxymethylpyrimidine/phosphomethylpyrimidine kinase [Acidihalobacter ferrooxydans]APZ42186.1 hydroxymethylpyrimidine/phosphomethylpyrimidine kinase [Acidihalobacter ferrooxydans]